MRVGEAAGTLGLALGLTVIEAVRFVEHPSGVNLSGLIYADLVFLGSLVYLALQAKRRRR